MKHNKVVGTSTRIVHDVWVGSAKQRPMNRLSTALPLAAMAVGLAAAGCSSGSPPAASRPAAPAPATTVAGRLQAPKTTPTEDAAYFRDLATVDQSLSKYVGSEQGVALQALLTDGAAFCAFSLNQGGGIDNAMESVVIGANSVEPKTHLPRSITTFNAIDAAALIALCPGEQGLIPKTSLEHIQALLSRPSPRAHASQNKGRGAAFFAAPLLQHDGISAC